MQAEQNVISTSTSPELWDRRYGRTLTPSDLIEITLNNLDFAGIENPIKNKLEIRDFQALDQWHSDWRGGALC